MDMTDEMLALARRHTAGMGNVEFLKGHIEDIPLPDGPYFCLAERTLPGGLIINQAGQRYVNEAAPYSDVVHVMYDKNPTAPCIPSWLVVDQNYRNRYLFRDTLPTLPLPDGWFTNGAVTKASSIESLATGQSPLTIREREVLAESSDGGTISDIARSLHLSEGTVRNHLSSAIGKTGARTRAEAARLAEERGWL
ncbi:LuxR C-terminal-related transcriptional regulator [Kibdelosporangium lantanae]|uniref:LuxR C-terminal-related transcriptional regulator n=1 Tax=Kibdelosporangium lantanae TaxID=1497396 RepID=A0ABW3MMY7_9PSEU